MAIDGPRPSDPHRGSAPLLDLDPDLAGDLEASARASLHRRAVVPTVHVPIGPWDPTMLGDRHGAPLGLLVAEGLIIRDVTIAGSPASELLGPGDVAGLADGSEPLIPATTAWTVMRPARVAGIDPTLLEAIQAWPAVTARLLSRAARQHARLAVARAISHLPHVEMRILALMWHLAERWGRVGKEGVVVPLELTHEALGRMVGARRPTVSLALKELAADGLVVRRPDATWVLAHAGLERLKPRG